MNQDSLFDKEKKETVECLGMTFNSDDERREYFRNELRERLPELKKIDGFPIGTDEDIIVLSDPPYYTACPNPWMDNVIKDWEESKVFQERNVKHAYVTDIAEGKNDPIYTSHTYHTKVPYKAIMKYILYYTNPGDIILDPYSGTGMTGVAAYSCGDEKLLNDIGVFFGDNDIKVDEQQSIIGERHAVLNDLSPAASYISNMFNSPRDSNKISKKIEVIVNDVKREWGWVYNTIATNDQEIKLQMIKELNQVKGLQEMKEYMERFESYLGRIQYVVWSDVFNCNNCNHEVIYFENGIDWENYATLKTFKCPNCDAILNKRLIDHIFEKHYDKFLKKDISMAKQVPVKVSYIYNGRRLNKTIDDFDIKLIDKIASLMNYNGFPTDELPKGYNTKQPKESHGICYVHQFYTLRNLLIISEFWKKIDLRNRWLLTSFISRNATKMNRFVINKYNPKGRVNGPLSATLYLPSLSVEQSIFELIEDKMKTTSWNTNGNLLEVASASDLKIKSETIDYIFMDPPFGANIMYSEVNYIWESWLRLKTNNRDEAIQNPVQGKDIYSYRRLMLEGLKECYRVLKPGKWITIEFSNTQAAIWNAIQSVVQEVGFVISSVGILDKKHGGIRAMTNPTSVKQDLVISAYKPSGSVLAEIKNNKDSILSVFSFLNYHLDKLPTFVGEKGSAELITERTPKVLFDRTVAYHVQSGLPVPISSSEFQEKVAQKYVIRDGMVFLESQVAEYDKKRILAKDFAQQSLFVSDESSAIEWLRQKLLKKPQSRQDIQPQFMKEIQHIAKHEELPELDNLLVENFLFYDDEAPVPAQIASYLRKNYHDLRGLSNDNTKLKSKAKNRWYVPDPSKQADLEKLREKSLLREFGHYVDEVVGTKKKLKVFRTEAIRAGFKKAWSEKNYQKIVDVADRLPEKVIQEDDKLLMYYDNASIRLDF